MAKVYRMWGGFVSGKLHVYQDSVDGRRACLFQSRARAKLAYSDVRLLEIREAKVRRSSTTTEKR